MAASSVGPAELARFAAFVARAAPLRSATAAAPDVAAFRHWTKAAGRTLRLPLQADSARLVKFAALAAAWRSDHDLLAVAGFQFAEDPYTELIRWALHPDTHPPSALARQAALLSFFGGDERVTAIPTTQFATADGIPDLVLAWDTRVIVIEAKTGSMEHVTPLGGWQTESYAVSVGERLQLPDHVAVQVGYLTPDASPARSATAVPISFAALLERLASALDRASLPSGTAAAFDMMFTHMLRHALPRGLNVEPALDALSMDGAEGVALSHVPTLLTLRSILDCECP